MNKSQGIKKELFLKVYLKPNAKKDEVLGEHDGHLKICVRAPATENKANDALINFLAEQFDVPKSHVILVKGFKSKQKLVKIISPKNDIPIVLQDVK